jgi:Stress responsive A/B Barrel Domain
MSLSNKFVHHVYFWLTDPDNREDHTALVAGLRKLAAAPMIRDCHIGQPAGTDRAVIDTSYAVSWLVLFDSAEDQDRYQTDPIHLQFIKECSPLYNKVVVFDSVDV